MIINQQFIINYSVGITFGQWWNVTKYIYSQLKYNIDTSTLLEYFHFLLSTRVQTCYTFYSTTFILKLQLLEMIYLLNLLTFCINIVNCRLYYYKLSLPAVYKVIKIISTFICLLYT